MFLKLSISIFILLSCSYVWASMEQFRDAIRQGDLNAVSQAVEAGVDVNQNLNEFGQTLGTPFHLAIASQQPEVVNLLIELGANVNARGGLYDRLETPLFEAIDKNNLEIIEALLKAGADVNAKNEKKKTPLHNARSPEATEFLLTAGANVNAQDDRGKTPLFFVDSERAAEILLNAGTVQKASSKVAQIVLPVGVAEKVSSWEEWVLPRQAFDTNKYVRRYVSRVKFEELFNQWKSNKKDGKQTPEREIPECRYARFSLIRPIKCGRRNICVNTVKCSLDVDVGGYTGKWYVTQGVDRSFKAVCSALPNGDCPTATECVLEEPELSTQPQPTSGNSPPKNTSKGVR